MREYLVDYDVEAEADVARIGEWVASMHTREFAIKYINRLFDEIESLSFLADTLPRSPYGIPLLYHPNAKTMTVGNRKLTVIFHTDGDYVVVDKILPSALMKY